MKTTQYERINSDERTVGRAWEARAIALINAEATRSASTPLLRFELSAFDSVDLYFKDEAAHPTGSLKHRLARSLFVHALCSGDIGPDTPIVEASSGSTAVSEAYFAQIIGLPFFAVVPRTTSREKVALIEQYGGRCVKADDATAVVYEAKRLADDSGGYFMDQFSHAAEATNWRCDNIAEEIFHQMRNERYPEPLWAVVGAGTGGTSTTLARYVRYRGLGTRIGVVDPEGSAFYEGWRSRDTTVTTRTPSRIEGIGRTRVEPSFFPALVDEVIPVPDAASIAAMRWGSEHLGRRVGASTGANLWGVLGLIERVAAAESGASLVSLICDSGARYQSTYFNDDWVAAQGLDIRPYSDALRRFERTGALVLSDL